MNENISVIIRTKNEERWIGHSIQSVIEKIKNPEIIIIDNKSEDDTLNIAKHFIKDTSLSESDPNKYVDIKILKINEYTPGKAINLGIKNSSNSYCMVLSAHCVLQNFNISIIEKTSDYSAIFGKQIPVWNGKKITKRYIWSHFGNDEVINMYSNSERRYFFHNAASFFKKDFIIDNPFNENLLGKEDRYWANEIVNKNFKILYDPSFIVDHHYTINGNTWKGLG